MKEFYKWAFAINTPPYIGVIMIMLHILAALFYIFMAVYLGSIGMFLLIPAAAIYVVLAEWKKHKAGKTELPPPYPHTCK